MRNNEKDNKGNQCNNIDIQQSRDVIKKLK